VKRRRSRPRRRRRRRSRGRLSPSTPAVGGRGQPGRRVGALELGGRFASAIFTLPGEPLWPPPDPSPLAESRTLAAGAVRGELDGMREREAAAVEDPVELPGSAIASRLFTTSSLRRTLAGADWASLLAEASAGNQRRRRRHRSNRFSTISLTTQTTAVSAQLMSTNSRTYMNGVSARRNATSPPFGGGPRPGSQTQPQDAATNGRSRPVGEFARAPGRLKPPVRCHPGQLLCEQPLPQPSCAR
jgi:hypothetical protein